MGIVRKGVVLVCLVLPSSGFAETSDLQAGQVRATYNAGVANLNLGTFDMTATLGRNHYALTASGEVSILAGLLYRAAGKTESNGARAGSGPEPQRYQFSFTDAKKTQTVQIGFDRGAVQSVKRTPKKNADRKAVPIPEGELRDVLDPLTAAFMSVQSNAPAGDLAVCDRTLRVFDGKQRFDLTLSPKRTEQLGAGAPDGLPDTAAVCRVAYKPIGGYRRETYAVQFLQESDGIEAWLVPVEGTGLYVPYKVIVPTTWGDGALKLTGIEARPSSPQRASAR